MQTWDIVSEICDACEKDKNVEITTRKGEIVIANPEEICVTGTHVDFNSTRIRNQDIKSIQTV